MKFNVLHNKAYLVALIATTTFGYVAFQFDRIPPIRWMCP